ncbi:MAG: S-methyl-5-thioribose-1-phosphate isomerase [Candidatus Omnitrophota bacterium]|jgi:methylthioribose-1-phosphate isomerase|nr:MAG: S-methyl-5-thioribose-1-phosphate isomerase [Candidatus Omnitrophota bacterium]
MFVETIAWKQGKVKIVDQNALPGRLVFLAMRNTKDLCGAIRTMKIRGAPALGAAAAFAAYLGIKNSKAKDYKELEKELKRLIKLVGSSRPTARNLFWGLEKIEAALQRNRDCSVPGIKQALLKEALSLLEQDKFVSRKIGSFGQALINNGDRVLTVCNAGGLATIDYGTALGVMYAAKEKGKKIKVFVCETRPMLQGARLTTWELKRHGIDVTLICDNMAATLMRQGKIDKVVVGADRIAANGDTANKIGTYSVAVLSKYHKVPFYVAAPSSTFDLRISSGKEIPIEERPKEEVVSLFFEKPIAPEGIRVFNPAFDVTPQKLITAIITEKGILKPPFSKNIAKRIKD